MAAHVLFSILLVFLSSAVLPGSTQDDDQSSFFASRGSNSQFPLGVSLERTKIEHNPGDNGVNADSIIGPIMQPLAKMFNYVADNRRTEEYAEKLEENEKSSIFNTESLLKALSGNDEETQTKSPSLMEKLFEPFIAPVKREMYRVKASTPGNIFQGLFTTPRPPVNSDGVRRAEPSSASASAAAALPQPFDLGSSPLESLLQPLGINAAKDTDELQVGRDRTISILGMPVGRRDGLALSPMKGLSYGNQDMLGPIAVNDKYNLQWDFFDKIGSMFSPQGTNNQAFVGNIMKMFQQ